MQRTRKRIHQYNDHLGDLIYMNRDGRPCKKCRERIRRECQGLIFELQRAEDQLKESKMIYKIPCDCKDISRNIKTKKKIFLLSFIIPHACRKGQIKTVKKNILFVQTKKLFDRTNWDLFA